MKILITGGTTFVSKYAAEYFVSKDNDVTVINRGSRPQVNGVAHISCDRTALKPILSRLPRNSPAVITPFGAITE